MIELKELREWQKKAKECYIANNKKGIIEACTGSGKTMIALNIAMHSYLTEKILIVVPTIALLKQWELELNNFGLSCGLIGDGKFTEDRITIAVINSVRELSLNYDILIMDECHHYVSEINGLLLRQNKFQEILGLSATITKEIEEEFNKLGLKIIFKYEQKQAIKENILNNYIIENIGLEFDINNKIKYEERENKINDYCEKHKIKPFEAYKNNNKIYFPIKKWYSQRKIHININKEKIIKCCCLILKNLDKKIIVFSEYIIVINKIKELLEKRNIKCAVYHSKMKNKEKKELLEKYRTGEINIILSVKALDEGLNVPDTNLAIIVGGNSTKRQIIQRLGRILRKIEGKTAKLIQLYIKNTVDEKYMKKRLSFLKS